MAVFTFGLIADVQYADTDDAYNFIQTKRRYYRNSLTTLQSAVTTWLNQPQRVNCVLQLGDLIDGKNHALKQSDSALRKTLDIFGQLGNVPIHHVIGNHELYNFSRQQLLETQLHSKLAKSYNVFYYAVSISPGFLLIVLDTYGLSAIDRNAAGYDQARIFLKKYNKSDDMNDWSMLSKSEKRFTEFNGSIDDTQLNWLNDTLQQAEETKQKVFITGHIPIYPKATDRVCLLWNYEQVLEVLHRYSCVRAYFAGHTHDARDAVDGHGIHHITLPAVVENKSASFSTARVYEGYALVDITDDGTGARTLKINLLPDN